jgi:hypothetical protein
LEDWGEREGSGENIGNPCQLPEDFHGIFIVVERNAKVVCSGTEDEREGSGEKTGNP